VILRPLATEKAMKKMEEENTMVLKIKKGFYLQ
jgi:ribosomal protein L23